MQVHKRVKVRTFFYGIYEDLTRQFTYVNAGHNPPFLLRDGRISNLDPSGTVIGLFPNREYERVQIQLATGDLLPLFTDGVVEARNIEEEEYGEEKLAEFLLQNNAAGAKGFVTALLKEIATFVGNAPQHDDLTVVLLKIL